MKKVLKIFLEMDLRVYRIFFISFILDLILLDQVSKYVVRFYLETPISITSFFKIIFVENTGVAFSFPIPEQIIFLLAFGVSCYLFSFLWKRKVSLISYVSYILIFSGAVGNVLDRIFYGSVTDFLSFWNFAVFNFADIFIFCGVGLLLAEEIIKPTRS